MTDTVPAKGAGRVWLVISVTAALVGLGLAADSALRTSATYDEVTYLKVAAAWWRTGSCDAITRMGSPTLFFKIQQAPVLWLLDRAGFGRVIDDPERYQEALLPLVRLGSLPVWLIALAITAAWAKAAYGPRAMALAAALFAISPNLLAHGSLATMETPMVACSAAMFALFWRFLRFGERASFAASAAVGGLAFSCKYTVAMIPPIFTLLWWVQRRTRGEGLARRAAVIVRGMIAFLLILAATNLILTRFDTTPLSPNTGGHRSVDSRFGGAVGRFFGAALETPVPRELVGFVVQTRLQGQGGSSYLLGARRERGWWYYYFVTLAVKVPTTFFLLIAGRAWLAWRQRRQEHDGMMPLAIALFLAITAVASSRNYGIRYLLPMAPVAIVWVSALGEARWPWRVLSIIGLVGPAVAVASSHPHELCTFTPWVGGPAGGRKILADSNLDWGQGLKDLARLQRARPEFLDLTLYSFGETDPGHYGVRGTVYLVDATGYRTHLPARLEASTHYVAVSSSLQFGPWGPLGYFRELDDREPVLLLPGATIAIYRAEGLPGKRDPQ